MLPPAGQKQSSAGYRIFNGVRCRICHRPLKAEPWRSLGIGPLCAFRTGEYHAIRTVTDMLFKGLSRGSWKQKEVSPVPMLESLGYRFDEIAKADFEGIAISMAELYSVTINLVAGNRLAHSSSSLARVANAARDSFAALDIANQVYTRSFLLDGANGAKEIEIKASVICCGLRSLRSVADLVAALPDNALSHQEAKVLRTNLAQGLISSRLYRHIVAEKRAKACVDQLQQNFSDFLRGDELDQSAAATRRQPIDLSWDSPQVIETMAEGNAIAKGVLNSQARGLSAEDFVTLVSLMDDMNIRGRQIAVLADRFKCTVDSNPTGQSPATDLVRLFDDPQLIVETLNAESKHPGDRAELAVLPGEGRIGTKPNAERHNLPKDRGKKSTLDAPNRGHKQGSDRGTK